MTRPERERPLPLARASVAPAVSLALPLALLAWKAWDRRWMSDDGLINLRVVDQVVAGHGPVFNAGERVEAATSPLWIWMLTLGDVLTPIRLEYLAVLTGIALTLVGLAAAVLGAQRLWHRASTGVLVPIGALCLAVVAPVWDFSSSGLEGGLAFAWLGLALLSLQRWAEGDQSGRGCSVGLAVLLGLGPLIRPDFVIFSAVFLAALLAGERGTSRRRKLVILGRAVALPAAYEVFRVVYYGALVPNTYFAKEGGRANWSQGWTYLADFVGPYRLWVPLLGLGATALVPLVARLHRRGERRSELVAVAFPFGGVLSALVIVRLGGDFMHGRLLLPALFALLAPVAVIAVDRVTAWAVPLLGWAAVCLMAFEPRTFGEARFRDGISDARSWIHELLQHDHLITLDDYGYAPGGPRYFTFDDQHRLYFGTEPVEVDGRPVALTDDAPERVLVAYGVGAVGYRAGPDTYVLDMLGLGDVLAARLELDERGRLPGHEKAMPVAWVWARYFSPEVDVDPTLLAPPAVLVESSPTLSTSQDVDLAAQVDAARDVLACGDLEELLDAPRRALGPGVMVDNVIQAFNSFSFRVPPQPTVARRDVC